MVFDQYNLSYLSPEIRSLSLDFTKDESHVSKMGHIPYNRRIPKEVKVSQVENGI